MAIDVLIETEVDADLKDRASAVLDTMGLTVADVIELLLTKIAIEGKLPPDFLTAPPEQAE